MIRDIHQYFGKVYEVHCYLSEISLHFCQYTHVASWHVVAALYVNSCTAKHSTVEQGFPNRDTCTLSGIFRNFKDTLQPELKFLVCKGDVLTPYCGDLGTKSHLVFNRIRVQNPIQIAEKASFLAFNRGFGLIA